MGRHSPLAFILEGLRIALDHWFSANCSFNGASYDSKIGCIQFLTAGAKNYEFSLLLFLQFAKKNNGPLSYMQLTEPVQWSSGLHAAH